MKKIAISIILLACGALALRFSAGCTDMRNNLHISFLAIQLQTVGDIHNDVHMSFFLIRFFHNRITATLIAVMKTYLAYFNFLFLFRLISFGSFIGIFLGLWYGFSDKRKRVKILLAVTFSLPLLLMFLPANSTQFTQLIPFALFLISCSLYGWQMFLQKCPKAFLPTAGIVFLITAWWFFAFQFSILHFCTLQ